jgi:hypothetical protein
MSQHELWGVNAAGISSTGASFFFVTTLWFCSWNRKGQIQIELPLLAHLSQIDASSAALRFAPSSLMFSHRIPSVRLTFFLQAKKVSKKARSPNYVLHPIIYEI